MKHAPGIGPVQDYCTKSGAHRLAAMLADYGVMPVFEVVPEGSMPETREGLAHWAVRSNLKNGRARR